MLKKTNPHSILLYGGSFDPPHLGHLNTALAVQKHIPFERFIFLPCKNPVLKKETTASSDQRVHMIKLMLESQPHTSPRRPERSEGSPSKFEIDLREIQRETASYMVDTLQSYREELGVEVSITLLLGMDAFLQLPQWQSWERILELGHLLVMKRAQIDETTTSLKSLLETHEIFDKTQLLNHACGKIYQYNAGEYAISSSVLRIKIESGVDVHDYLPELVYRYINERKIYSTI